MDTPKDHSAPRPLEALLKPPPPLRGARRDTAELIAKVAGGPWARDIALLAPTGAIDRRRRVAIVDAPEGEISTIEAEVDAHVPAFNSKTPYRVRLRDETGFLSIVYFRPNKEMLERLWPVGQTRLVSGKVEIYQGERQMTHPDHVVDPARGEAPPSVEPVYPLTAGLPGRTLARAVKQSVLALPDLPEWLDPASVSHWGWMQTADALRRLHTPEEPGDVLASGPIRTRLAYDELFARQVALRLRRARRRRLAGRAIVGDGHFIGPLLSSLPFEPTGAQARAAREIDSDMANSTPMQRLLQGDVGSGKTLVAALAMARAAEAGVQSALMAPTDILARQHGATLVPLLEAAGVKIAVLTGRDKGRERKALLEGLANGNIQAVVGTHALFQSQVAFRDLGLIVIDEQHRFGVSDRARLIEKGIQPHVLVMSATPIPRTIALAVHGDMDLSILDEKPPGRKPVRTVTLPMSRLDDVMEAIARAISKGERAYWVCPLIAESEAVDLAAVEDRYEILREQFGAAVEVLHGRMAGPTREAAMDRFKSGEASILVATTVIEVGVNVPEATIMVIEHAERFGLAQLHQLRGRIGRGDQPGACLLLWKPPLSENAKTRLDALRRSDDGFAIAEIDYKMRGAGDVLGVRQSGLPAFRMVDPDIHAGLLAQADQEARILVDRDPQLLSERGAAARLALRLFGCDEDSLEAQAG
jgi:ATP-dependent DNA helicase RecG